MLSLKHSTPREALVILQDHDRSCNLVLQSTIHITTCLSCIRIHSRTLHSPAILLSRSRNADTQSCFCRNARLHCTHAVSTHHARCILFFPLLFIHDCLSPLASGVWDLRISCHLGARGRKNKQEFKLESDAVFLMKRRVIRNNQRQMTFHQFA